MMNQKERMLAELPYKAWLDGLAQERLAAKTLTWEYNQCHPANQERKASIIKALLGKVGGACIIEPPFQCDYGYNIEIGENFYSNHNLIILDVAKVSIGKNVMFGPNVTLLTAGHPVHYQSRLSGYEYGISISIGDNVWLGSNVVVNPGVVIGSNSVIASGSVVTKNVDPLCVYGGVPCRKIREISDEDKHYYFKNRRFDVDDYLSSIL